LWGDEGKTTAAVVARGESVVGADGTRGYSIVGLMCAAATIARNKELLLEALLFEDDPPGHHFELLAPSLSLGELVFQAANAKGGFVVAVINAFVVEFFLEVLCHDGADLNPQFVADADQILFRKIRVCDFFFRHFFEGSDFSDSDPFVEGYRPSGFLVIATTTAI